MCETSILDEQYEAKFSVLMEVSAITLRKKKARCSRWRRRVGGRDGGAVERDGGAQAGLQASLRRILLLLPILHGTGQSPAEGHAVRPGLSWVSA